MFLQNKYTNIYNNIINRAKSRVLSENIYAESHHIIPKSLGGSNAKSNLVNLTAREHRLAHLLLPKMTISATDTNKMWYAAWLILRVKNPSQERTISKGRFYELAKIKFSQMMSLKHKGKSVSEETRKKMSENATGRVSPNKGKIMSDEQKQKLSKAHTGKVIAQSTIDKILESRKGYKHSEETKKKISDSQLGKIMPPISQEHKDAISKKLKGRMMSEETKRKMSKSRKAYWANKQGI